MFTGIITDVGALHEITRPEGGDARLWIVTTYALEDVALGASIACAGVCLTVVEKDAAAGRFAVDASAETLTKTTIGGWAAGRRINLERALKVGDELGGHIVTGHVDGVVDVLEAAPIGDSTRLTLQCPPPLAPFVAEKGSAALDGCSLTVNRVLDQADGSAHFTVNLIPHTKRWTSFGALTAGDRLNFEIDVLARYVKRLNEASGSG